MAGTAHPAVRPNGKRQPLGRVKAESPSNPNLCDTQWPVHSARSASRLHAGLGARTQTMSGIYE